MTLSAILIPNYHDLILNHNSRHFNGEVLKNLNFNKKTDSSDVHLTIHFFNYQRHRIGVL